jgi:hypothetical protein
MPSKAGPASSGACSAVFTASRSMNAAASSAVRAGAFARGAGRPLVAPSPVSARTRASTSASSVLPSMPASCGRTPGAARGP